MDLLEGQPQQKNHLPDISSEISSLSQELSEISLHAEEFAEELPTPVSGSEEISAEEKGEIEKSQNVGRAQLEKFLAALAEKSDLEGKLHLALQFMENALSQGGAPNFKHFWEGRKASIELFKEAGISPNVRFQLWTKYTELAKEGHRLKAILDEQSAFAAEQIDIAITALEQDIVQQEEGKAKTQLIEFPASAVLAPKMTFYVEAQSELNLLNTYASRINGLRKELIKTDIRVRHKNKFFQRLSTAGDHVFPRRKERIKEVSQQFYQDVLAFIAEHFKEGQENRSSFFLREEIKALQGIAKALTLNTQCFTQTRLLLSECWDKIKNLEKERKKERAQFRAVSKVNEEEVRKKIQEFHEVYAGLTIPQAQAKLDEVITFMGSQQLGYDEVKLLREEIGKARRLVLDKTKTEEELRQKQEQERQKAKREQVQQFQQRVETLLKQHHQYDANSLTAQRDALLAEINELPISKPEKQELEKQFRPFRDLISEKKEQALFAMSDDDRQSYQQLLTIYKERKERREECKAQWEAHRRSKGSSGMSFEKAFEYNQLLLEEKNRLDKLNQSVKEIEDKIREMEKKLEQKDL